MVKYKEDLIPAWKYSIKAPYLMIPEFITIHNTANDATAQGEINYMTGNNSATGYHFATDDKQDILGIPLNRCAFACGDGLYGTGNRKSISIEICYSKSGGAKYRKAVARAVKLTAFLLHERNWGTERVKPHRHWSGKNCPHRIFADREWDTFIANVAKELKALKNGTATPSVSFTDAPRGYLISGDNGAAVLKLQKLLIMAGYSVGKDGADSYYGDDTKAAVLKLQEDYKLAKDGVAGNATMQVLEALTAKSRDYVQNGDYGKEVKLVQEQLKFLGYDVGAIDSRFGRATEEALRAFQVDVKIQVDGVAGATTRKYLKGRVAVKKRDDAKKAAEAKKKAEEAAKAPKPSEVDTSIGTLKVLASRLNVRASASFDSKVVKTLKKNGVYKVYHQKNGLYNVGLNQYVSAGKEYVKFTKHKKVRILPKALYTYRTADWNDKGLVVRQNEVYTVIREVEVDGAMMYQIASGLYISASTKYVKVL